LTDYRALHQDYDHNDFKWGVTHVRAGAGRRGAAASPLLVAVADRLAGSLSFDIGPTFRLAR
jgi:hypothetical protein